MPPAFRRGGPYNFGDPDALLLLVDALIEDVSSVAEYIAAHKSPFDQRIGVIRKTDGIVSLWRSGSILW